MAALESSRVAEAAALAEEEERLKKNTLFRVYGEQKIETAKFFLRVANRKPNLRLPKMCMGNTCCGRKI